jgi:hypothetical protein
MHMLGATPIPEASPTPLDLRPQDPIPSRSPHWFDEKKRRSRRIRDADVNLLLYFWNRKETCRTAVSRERHLGYHHPFLCVVLAAMDLATGETTP